MMQKFHFELSQASDQGRNTMQQKALTDDHNKHQSQMKSSYNQDLQFGPNVEQFQGNDQLRTPQLIGSKSQMSVLPLHMHQHRQLTQITPFSISPTNQFLQQRQQSLRKVAKSLKKLKVSYVQNFPFYYNSRLSDLFYSQQSATSTTNQSVKQAIKQMNFTKQTKKRSGTQQIPQILVTICDDETQQGNAIRLSNQNNNLQQQQQKLQQFKTSSQSTISNQRQNNKEASLNEKRRIYLHEYRNDKQSAKNPLLKTSQSNNSVFDQNTQSQQHHQLSTISQSPQVIQQKKMPARVMSQRTLAKNKSKEELKIIDLSPGLKQQSRNNLKVNNGDSKTLDGQQSTQQSDVFNVQLTRKKTLVQIQNKSKASADDILYGFHRSQTYFRSRSIGRQRQIQISKMKRLIIDLYQRDHSETSQLSVSIHTLDSDLEGHTDRKNQNIDTEMAIEDLDNKQQDQAIFEIVYSNDCSQLQSFFNQIQSKILMSRIINARDSLKRSPLFYAVYHNNYEMIHLLLQNGAETFFSDDKNRSIIHYACIVGVSKPILQLLLDYHEKLNIQDSHLEEALTEQKRRKININDFPRGSRPSILQIQPPTYTNFKNIEDSQSNLQPQNPLAQKLIQPLSSLLKIGRGLDTNALKKVAYDDNFNDSRNNNINEESENSMNTSSNGGSIHNVLSKCLQTQLFNIGKGMENNPFKNIMTNLMSEKQKKMDLERKIKRTTQYKNSTKLLINLADSKGKTALHYAAFKGYIHLVKLLIKNNGITFVRDYKQRVILICLFKVFQKAIELTEKAEIISLISNAESIFEERFSQGSLKLRKTLILDDYETITNSGQPPSITEVQQKSQEKKAKLQKQMTIIKEEPEIKISGNVRINSKLSLGKTELSSLSDDFLSKFCIGLYKDNSLTHKMRFDDKENFQYLIKRRVSILESDKNGHNCVHHAVIMEKVEFLSYLFEGSFISSIFSQCKQNIRDIKDSFILEKAKQGIELINSKTCNWIVESLVALEKSNLKEGNTTLHIAIDNGNRHLFNYLMIVFKIREKMRELVPDLFRPLFKPFSEILEFQNKFECTPLLFASKRNQFKIFEALIEEGSSLYSCCNKLMNVLHYAILNENSQLIELIVFADAEGNKLSNERNFRNETPKNLDDKCKFDHIIHHIWEAASVNNVDRIQWLIKNGKQTLNQKTLVGLNTPLHFAVINENLKTIEFLCRQPEIQLSEKNALGQTPQDIALLIPKKRVSVKIIEFLQKRRERKMTFQMNKLISSPAKNSSQVAENLSNKLRMQSSVSSISSQKSKILSASSQRQFKSCIYRQATRKLQTRLSIVCQAGVTEQQSLQRSLLQSEFSEDYDQLFNNFDTEHPAPKRRLNQVWEFDNVQQLVQQYDAFIENQGQIGMFDAEIFKRWKQAIIKMNDYKKIEYVDIFKRLDEQKRGMIKADCMLHNISKIVAECDQMKFVDYVNRYYSDTKITESLFIKMMLTFFKSEPTMADKHQSNIPSQSSNKKAGFIGDGFEPSRNQPNFAKENKSFAYSDYLKYNQSTQLSDSNKQNASKHIFKTINSSVIEAKNYHSQKSQQDEGPMREIMQCLNKLIYVKGELMTEQFNIVIKRSLLANVFVESGLLERKDVNYFDIMMTKEFGNKPSHGGQDLEKIILIIAQNFYGTNFQEQPKGTIEAMVSKHLRPYVEGLLSTFKSTLKLVLTDWNENQQVHPFLLMKKDSLRVIFNFYKEKALSYKEQNQRKIVFTKCILPMMKDFEICPIIIKEKDLFILYTLLFENENNFMLDEFLLMLQNISHFYLSEIWSLGEDATEQQIDILMKRIEISEGYTRFRKTITLTQQKKIPSLFSSTVGAPSASKIRGSNQSLLQDAINSARKTYSKQNQLNPSFVEPDLNEEQRHQLQQLFEYYASFGEPLNTDYMKTSRLIKMCKEINILNKENKYNISIRELDLLVIKVSGNTGGKINFEQFLIVLQVIANKICQTGEPLQTFIESKLAPHLQQIEQKKNKKSQVFDQESLNSKILELNNDSIIQILSLLKESLEPYFKMHSHKQQGKIMSYNGFSQFCSQFEIFPDLISISNLYMLYNNLILDGEHDGKIGFDINLLVEALGLIALETFQNIEEQYTPEQKLLLLAERFALLQPKVDEKLRQTYKNNFDITIDHHNRDILNVFWKLFQQHFPKQLSDRQLKQKTVSLRDIMNKEDQMRQQEEEL